MQYYARAIVRVGSIYYQFGKILSITLLKNLVLFIKMRREKDISRVDVRIYGICVKKYMDSAEGEIDKETTEAM